MKTKIKTDKIKTILKIIIIFIVTMTLITIYTKHKDTQREEYARENNCKWVIYSGYELCK